MLEKLLLGSSIVSIDEKGRIILPTEYEMKSEDAFMRLDNEYISIYSKSMQIDNHLAASMKLISIDKEKRITLLRAIRTAYLFENKAAIIGRNTHIDIVPKEKLDKYLEENQYEKKYEDEKNLILTLKK